MKKNPWIWLFIGWGIIIFFGLLAQYSSTYGKLPYAIPSSLQQTFLKQLTWYGVLIIMAFILMRIHPLFISKYSYTWYSLSMVLLILTLFIGKEVNGAKSWLSIMNVNIQPSELVKATTVLALTYFFSFQNRKRNYITMIQGSMFVIFPAIICILQNDLGTALIYLSLLSLIIICASPSLSHTIIIYGIPSIIFLTLYSIPLAILLSIFIIIIVFFINRNLWTTLISTTCYGIVLFAVVTNFFGLLRPHHIQRMEIFLDPTLDPYNAGWNTIQTNIAIGSGGWFGKGWLEGTQTQLRFVSEQSTDFIYGVIGEELGFFGTISIIASYGILFFSMLALASNVYKTSNKSYPAFLTHFTVIIFFTHTLLNIGGILQILPVIGVPLPFISYGGSALISHGIMLILCCKFLHVYELSKKK